MKINILVGSLGGGGAERVVSEICQNTPNGIDVDVSMFTSKYYLYSTGKSETFIFEDSRRVTTLSQLLYKANRRILFRVYMHLFHLKTQEYDVVVSFLTHPNIVNLLVCHYLHLPCVISIRNNINTNGAFVDNILTRVVLYLIKIYSPYLIVNSEENKDYLIKHCSLSPDKAICIYNPKDIDSIHTLQSEPLDGSFFETDEPVLLNVGRLTQQKGQFHLLRIFSKLRQTIPCRLVISGQGELESSLKSLAHNLGIEQYVLFTGWCDNPYKYMSRADIFVFSSLFEGQPNAMIEALICGCPIVSADCDYGPRDILEGGKYGLLTKKLDGKSLDPVHDSLTDAEQDMYEKIVYLIQHPEVRKEYAELSKDRIGIFAKEKIINEYYAVFKAAAEGKKLTEGVIQ